MNDKLNAELQDLFTEGLQNEHTQAEMKGRGKTLSREMKLVEEDSEGAWAKVAELLDAIWVESSENGTQFPGQACCFTHTLDGDKNVLALVISSDLATKLDSAMRISRGYRLRQKEGAEKTAAPQHHTASIRRRPQDPGRKQPPSLFRPYR
jgi:hypothetical protein